MDQLKWETLSDNRLNKFAGITLKMELNKCSRKVVQKKVGKSLRKLWIKNVSQTISDDLRLVAALLLSANNFVRYDIRYHFYFSEN